MKILGLIVVFLSSSLSWGASCCGGGAAFPALILGDDKAQVTTTYSYGQISDDVLGNGKWQQRKDNNRSDTFKIEAATLLSEYFQAGFSLPILRRQLSSQESSGLGDVSFNLAHETFPELSYSPWKPRGVTYLQITLPTSPSIYDAQTDFAVDSRGRGLYSLGAGLALVKNWTTYDAHLQSEVHRSWGRSFSSPSFGGQIQVEPGWGGSLLTGLGWNKGNLRLGASAGVVLEEAITITGAQNSSGALQKYFPLSLQGSFMPDMESSWTVSYTDQALLGNPNNTSLMKVATLSYQRRWPR